MHSPGRYPRIAEVLGLAHGRTLETRVRGINYSSINAEASPALHRAVDCDFDLQVVPFAIMIWDLLEPSRALCAAILLVLMLRYWKSSIDLHSRRRGLPFPPGPIRWPLLGNLFNAPSAWKPWLGYQKLIDKYGEFHHPSERFARN